MEQCGDGDASHSGEVETTTAASDVPPSARKAKGKRKRKGCRGKRGANKAGEKQATAATPRREDPLVLSIDAVLAPPREFCRSPCSGEGLGPAAWRPSAARPAVPHVSGGAGEARRRRSSMTSRAAAASVVVRMPSATGLPSPVSVPRVLRRVPTAATSAALSPVFRLASVWDGDSDVTAGVAADSQSSDNTSEDDDGNDDDSEIRSAVEQAVQMPRTDSSGSEAWMRYDGIGKHGNPVEEFSARYQPLPTPRLVSEAERRSVITSQMLSPPLQQLTQLEHSIGRAIRCGAKWEAVVEMSVEAVALATIASGPSSLRCSRAHLQLGQAYLQLQMGQPATQHVEQAEHILARLPSSDAPLPYLQQVLLTLGEVYADTGRAADALVVLRRASRLSKRLQAGPTVDLEHGIALTTAKVLISLERWPEALECMYRVWEIKDVQLGAMHVDMVPIYDLMATVHAELGNVTDAAEMYRRALDILPHSAPSYLDMLRRSAIVAGKAQQWDEATEDMVRVVTMTEQQCGAASAAAVSAMRDLALMQLRAGRHEDAIKQLQVLRRRVARVFGTASLRLADADKLLATAYAGAGQWQGATKHGLRSFAMYRDRLGVKHDKTVAATALLHRIRGELVQPKDPAQGASATHAA